ncbi:MAG: hypothetical protein AB7F86_20540, partial [Bdellovibrionales bacterium]
LLTSFSPATLLAGFVFGVFGNYLYRAGRKRVNYRWVGAGIAMMVYPLFVTNPWLCWLVGLALCGAAYFTR